MNKHDSAKIQFYRRRAEYCACVHCARVTVRLDVDFGSLLPEIDAERILTTDLEAPIDHWLFEGMIDWIPRGPWAELRPGLKMAAHSTVHDWIDLARAHILSMTGREILDALECCKSIEVPRLDQSSPANS